VTYCKLACLIIAALITACGEAVPQPVTSVPLIPLSVVDTIGADYGDSAYVLGSVLCMGHTPGGNIAVLDRPSASVKVFTRTGDHVCTIAGRGDGPGELASPDAMVLWPCGDISILDNHRGGYFRYSESGEYLYPELEIYSNVHLDIIAVNDSEFVSVKSRFIEDEAVPQIAAFIGRFPYSIDPSVVYWETVLTFDPATFGDELLTYYFYMSWAADPETGNVYICPFSETDYRIFCYGPEGELFNEITAEAPVIEKSREEIQDETDFVRGWLTALEGGDPDYSVSCDPFPYRLPVSDLDVDGDGNIWARRGTEDVPFFDIWTPQGELVAQAVLQGVGPESRSWNFTIDKGGIAAFDEYPIDYQRIFIIQ